MRGVPVIAYQSAYAASEPDRPGIEASPGLTLLEFGAPWCGHCMALQPALQLALGSRPGIRHIKVEDGRGKPLGRSFRIKLWPTLVLMRDGQEVARVVRPREMPDLSDLLEAMDQPGQR